MEIGDIYKYIYSTCNLKFTARAQNDV